MSSKRHVQEESTTPRLQVILATLERGEAVLFYCKAGKDRTGILAALLLSLAGATDDQIISDYILCAPILPASLSIAHSRVSLFIFWCTGDMGNVLSSIYLSGICPNK